MELYCLFGNYLDLCSVVEWVSYDKIFLLLLSCIVDFSEWLKDKYKGFCVLGIRG